MAVDLQQTDAPSGSPEAAQVGCSGRSLSGGSPTYARLCTEGGTAGTTEILPALANLETTVVAYNDISDAIGVTSWDSGTYTWRLNITTTSATVTLEEVHVCRLNSSLVSQESLGSSTGLGQSLGSSGVISGNVTGSAATASASDVVAFIYVFSNSHSHGGDDPVGITPNQVLNTPIVAATPVTVNLTGAGATGTADDFITASAVSLTLPDLSSTGGVGTISAQLSASLTLSGVSTTGQAGEMGAQKTLDPAKKNALSFNGIG